jgi:hypothetical protein
MLRRIRCGPDTRQLSSGIANPICCFVCLPLRAALTDQGTQLKCWRAREHCFQARWILLLWRAGTSLHPQCWEPWPKETGRSHTGCGPRTRISPLEKISPICCFASSQRRVHTCHRGQVAHSVGMTRGKIPVRGKSLGARRHWQGEGVRTKKGGK